MGRDTEGERAPRDALPESTARLLREFLAGEQITQRQLAHDLGVTETTVSRWLARTHPIPLGQLRALADRLGVSLPFLFGGPASLAPPSQDPLEVLQSRIEALTQAVRDQMRLAPLYRDGDHGDPRGEDAGAGVEAATPAGYVQLLPGHERAIGPRGFALSVPHDDLAGRGVWRGDLCFANPDDRWTLGSLVVARLEDGLRLCEVALGPGGQHVYRTAPLEGPPEVWPGTAGVTVGPVLRVVRVARLKHGLGNADDRPGQAPDDAAHGVRYDIEGDSSPSPTPINTER